MNPTPAEWAKLLRENWDRRAASPHRDFYVASINDPERWKAQGEADVDGILLGLADGSLQSAHLLEIGCGVGRLAEPFLKKVKTYTGFDIAEGMVEEARRRCERLQDARFFLSDGLEVPAEARDRHYDLAIALAVFIHCPREVTASLVQSAYALLRPKGQLRFQLLADPRDPAGLEAPDLAQAGHDESQAMEQGATPEQMSLIDGQYYMGDTYSFGEVVPWLNELTGGDVWVFRPDLGHIYGWVEKA